MREGILHLCVQQHCEEIFIMRNIRKYFHTDKFCNKDFYTLSEVEDISLRHRNNSNKRRNCSHALNCINVGIIPIVSYTFCRVQEWLFLTTVIIFPAKYYALHVQESCFPHKGNFGTLYIKICCILRKTSNNLLNGYNLPQTLLPLHQVFLVDERLCVKIQHPFCQRLPVVELYRTTRLIATLNVLHVSP